MRAHNNGLVTIIALVGILLPFSLAGAASVNVSWNPNTETDLAGYRIYYGTNSRIYGVPIPVGKISTYTVDNLASATTYYLALTAIDTSGNESGFSDEIPVTTTSSADTTDPSVVITSPTSASSYSTSQTSVNLSGTASDNVGVTQVSWSNAAGGSGTASGTSAWSATNIALVTGSNVITVTAYDAAGNHGSDTITVTSVQSSFVDSDNDGIDDAWEIDKFGDLTTANAISDNDNDGYTDLQEYTNRNETDPLGAQYDPLVANAPNGTGYYRRKMMFDFGSVGMWHFDGDQTWTNLVPYDPQQIIPYNGALYCDFGITNPAARGLFAYVPTNPPGTKWVLMTRDDPHSMYTAISSLLVNFGSDQTTKGLWKRNGAVWSQITYLEVENVIPSPSGCYADFGSSPEPFTGLWRYTTSTGVWERITDLDCNFMTMVGEDLYCSFQTTDSRYTGVFRYTPSNRTWTRLTSVAPQRMASTGQDLFCDFGAPYFVYRFNNTWTNITGYSCDKMLSYGSDLVIDLGQSQSYKGLWLYHLGSWIQIKTQSPTFMTFANDTLVAQFGNDLMKHVSKKTWLNIGSSMPEGVIPGSPEEMVGVDFTP